ncbi:MAG TPA: hypothetical protein VGJ60_25745 [Chloroflexota bacterium]|jgi:hypothetical protein
MNPQLRSTVLRGTVAATFAIGLLLPSTVSAAVDQTSTGTLVGAVTCGADAITPASDAVISIGVLHIETHTSGDGRFVLTDVPAGQQLRLDAATDPDQSSMSSRFNVMVEPGQTLDVGSLDIAICPAPNTPAPTMSDQEIEQRGNPY